MSDVLLLSGGMDSVALAWQLRPRWAVTIDYGQGPAPAEIRAASAVADTLKIEHVVISADLSALGSGDLAGSTAIELAPVREWWPFRNQALVTLAAMRMLPLGANRLYMGCLATDGAHADGTPQFIAVMNTLLQLQEGAMSLEAPAIGMTAVELVQRSGIPMEVLAWAHSCHVGEYACGYCRGCHKHFETMSELGAEPY